MPDQNCPPDPLVNTGSPSDQGPYPRGAAPTFTVKDDTASGWKPEDDVPVVLPPPSGGPVPPVETQGGLDPEGYPVFTFSDITELCKDIGLSPDMISGVLAQLVIQHFSNPEWITYDELRGYTWDIDPAKRKIQILPVNKWEELAAGKMPAVVYADLGQNFQRLTIGDQFYTNPETYAEGYVRSCSGSHRFMCVADTDAAAVMLANEIARWLTEFAPLITRELPFHDFQVVSQGTPQAYNAIGGRIGVALVVQYTYIWAWELTPAGPPLKSLGSIPTH